jgi:hypothetical protein
MDHPQMEEYGMSRPILRLAALWLLLAAASVAAAPPSTNLVVNGSFDHPDDPLFGWKTEFTAAGESWYRDNKRLVSVVPQDSGRQNVLRLHVATQFLADNPGVKANSRPIPFDPTKKYRFSAHARSTGPNCRIMLEGYKWAPGVTPRDNPTISELRRCYRFKQLYFGDVQGGTMGGVGRHWKHASRILPEDGLSDLARRILGEVSFVVVHIVGIGGRAGELFVDDVVLERLD